VGQETENSEENICGICQSLHSYTKIFLYMKVKGMLLRVLAVKAYERGEVLFNFLTSDLMTSVISFTPLPLCSWRKVSRCSLNTILAESLSNSGCLGEEKDPYHC